MLPKYGAQEKILFRTKILKQHSEEYNQSATQGVVNLMLSASLTTLEIYVQKQVADIKLAVIDILRNVDIKINAKEVIPVSIVMMIN